jgi:hypothetical protein
MQALGFFARRRRTPSEPLARVVQSEWDLLPRIRREPPRVL